MRYDKSRQNKGISLLQKRSSNDKSNKGRLNLVKQMHILHLVKTSDTAIWVYDLIKAIRAKDKNVTFSVCLPGGGRHYKKYFEVCVNVYDFNFRIDASLLRQGLNLRRIVKKENPDIIHSWYTQTTLYARLFLRDIKIPRLFEVLGPLHLEFPLYRFLDICSAQRNDYWKATSKYTYNIYLKHGISEERLFFNYIATNFQVQINAMLNSPVVNLREKYKIQDDIKIIGTAAYMYPPKTFKKQGVKNHELLLEVFKKLLEKRDDVILVIGGTTLLEKDKHYEAKLKKIAHSISADKIIFTGWADNLGRLITEFDVFVFLSLSENLGGVYESLLFRVPTVASDRGGIPELIIDGETGFSCNLKSIDEIVDKIEALLANEALKEKFKTNGYLKVHELFNSETSINQSYNIYSRLI
jgi:glycosyltransferase involved in cell wall biosynthesis